MSASELVIVTCRDQTALDAVSAAVKHAPDAALSYVDGAVLTLAAEPHNIDAASLRTRLAALDGVDAAYVKPPDALP